MDFTSLVKQELLAILPDVVPDLDDVRASIGSNINMVATPGGIVRSSSLAATLKLSSAFMVNTWSFTNAAGAFTSMGFLSKGVWRLTGSFHFSGTIAAALPTSSLDIRQAGVSIGNLAVVRQNDVLAVNVAFYIDTQLSFDVTSEVGITLGTQGVSQTAVGGCCLLASRLL